MGLLWLRGEEDYVLEEKGALKRRKVLVRGKWLLFKRKRGLCIRGKGSS